MVRYNIRTGVKKIKTKTSMVITGAALAVTGLFMAVAMPWAAGAGAAPSSSYSLTPSTFVGALNDCGPGYPAGTPGGVVSEWDGTVGNPPPSIKLQKNVPTTDCSSADVTVNGVSGITLTELNFDVKTGEYCGAGAPRFNVLTSDNVTHFLGCAAGTQTDLGNGWTHVVFDPTNPAQAFPVIAPGTTVQSIGIVMDEQGQTHIDNVSINDQVIGSPNKDACKSNGWKTLKDANGKNFKNQGDCVSYFATGGKNPANGS